MASLQRSPYRSPDPVKKVQPKGAQTAARRYLSLPKKKDRELAEKITSIGFHSKDYNKPKYAAQSHQNSPVPEANREIKISPRVINSTLVKKNNDEERIYKIGLREEKEKKTEMPHIE
jgi:hypothetical protein